MMEVISMHALPAEVLVRPGFGDRIMAAAERREAFVPPGPSRGELLRMLA